MEDNQQKSDISKQRQQALHQLQGNRGNSRQAHGEATNSELEQARAVLKKYARQEKQKRLQSFNTDAAEGLSDLSKEIDLDEVLDEVDNDIDSALNTIELSTIGPTSQALQQLRQQVQSKRESKKRAETQAPPSSEAPVASTKQQHLIKQLLSEDFLENTRLWLSSTSEPEKEQPSTSLEELELYQKQVQYRMTVLDVLTMDTRRELEHLELQIRAARSVQHSSEN